MEGIHVIWGLYMPRCGDTGRLRRCFAMMLSAGSSTMVEVAAGLGRWVLAD
jgi:hypothetical protein